MSQPELRELYIQLGKSQENLRIIEMLMKYVQDASTTLEGQVLLGRIIDVVCKDETK